MGFIFLFCYDNGFNLFLLCVWVQEECCFCCHFIYPGDDELLCSVRGCDARYHSECAKDAVGASNLKKFKCPQHVGFLVT